VLPDRASCRAELPGDPDVPTIAFLGRLHPKKGIERLLEAMARLSGAGREVQLLIAGTGDAEYQRDLEEMARGLAGRVHFLGHIVGAAKTRFLRAADMLVLPSYQENFGLVLVEALACGTPVITTKAVDIWPELEASGSAILMDNPDAAIVAGAI